MLRNLCEFSALLQLGATFNFGCIALSGKSFAKSLANFFFKVDETIDKEFDSIKYQISTDKESIKQLKPRKIEGKDLDLDIKKLQNEIIDLESQRDKILKKVKSDIDKNFIPVCLDDMCLFLGFYSIYELGLVFAIKLSYDLAILFSTLNILCLIVILWLFICEIAHYLRVFSKMKISNKYLQIQEHKSYPSISLCILVISIIFYIINENLLNKTIPYYECFGQFNIIIGIILPFLGLFVYYFYVQFLSYKAHNYIKDSIKPIKEGFEELHKRKDQIDAVLTYFEKEDLEPI